MKNLVVQRGFSLLELSIVLIMVGLLTAGITAGKQLLSSAELTKQITQITGFQTDYRSFKATYNAVPGDFPKGFAAFGSATCTNNFVSAQADGCNGDGSGDLSGTNEGTLMWRHLALSGIMKANFSVYTSGTKVIGTHVPAGIIRGSGFYAAYDNYYGTVTSQDMFIMGATVANNDPYASVLTPRQAKNIDQKMDDAYPITGKILSGTSPSGSTGTCSNGSGSENLTGATEYSLSNNNIACRMIILYN